MGAIRLGLTGGIGSGKSTVASMLFNLGAAIIDADAISRATTAANGAAIDALEETFGPQIITAERSLNRDVMRQMAFGDPGVKKRLEDIIHPLVGQEIARLASNAEQVGAACIVFDIPLLVESAHWRRSLHRVVVVDCSEQTQIRRVTARNGLDESTIRQVIATQASRLMRLKAADLVLFNDAISLERLASDIEVIGRRFGL